MIRVFALAGALLATAQLHRAGGLGGAKTGVVIGILLLALVCAQVSIDLVCDRLGTRRTPAAALALVAWRG